MKSPASLQLLGREGSLDWCLANVTGQSSPCRVALFLEGLHILVIPFFIIMHIYSFVEGLLQYHQQELSKR